MDDLTEIFTTVSSKLNWKNYEVISDVVNEKGNGFMGEFFLATIKNKDTEEKVDLAVKCAFKNEERRKEGNMHVVFTNELVFYDKIMTVMMKFVEEKGLKFDFLPRFLGGIYEDGREMIAMENIRSLGYKLVDRNQLLDEDHVRFVFETYGKFHGMSFAFKDQNPGEYWELLGQGYNVMDEFRKQGSQAFGITLKGACETAFATVDEEIRKNCKVYIENPISILFEYNQDYKGDFGCLLHGDCWSNNMMFKYDGISVTGVKLLDFQLMRHGPPAMDLSYFLYAGTSVEIYGNLDKYLKIYHDSLCKTVSNLGSDPSKLFPWENLKKDWTIYSKCGFLLSILVNKIKLMENADMQNLVNGPQFVEQMGTVQLGDDKLGTYRRRCKDLIEHAYKEGFLQSDLQRL